MSWITSLTSQQWWAAGIGLAAIAVLFWEQILGLWNRVPDIIPDVPTPAEDDQIDLDDLRAVHRLDERAIRLKSAELTTAVTAVKANFFGG